MSGESLRKLSGAAIDDYFRNIKQKRVTEGHRWLNPKGIPWLTYCFNCGLIWAKNKITQKSIKQGCISYVQVFE